MEAEVLRLPLGHHRHLHHRPAESPDHRDPRAVALDCHPPSVSEEAAEVAQAVVSASAAVERAGAEMAQALAHTYTSC